VNQSVSAQPAATLTGDQSLDRFQRLVSEANARYTTVGDFAYSMLREAILRGILEPGQHIRQDALAEALGISRIPVRSALLQLESDGLVEIRPHRGAVVKIHTPEHIRQIYQARIVLETYALRRAIGSMTPEWLRRLEELAERVDAVDRAHPTDAWIAAGTQFYRELYGPVNQVIATLSERLRADVGRYWHRPLADHSAEQVHAKLIEYIRRRDADGAARWLERHLTAVAEQVAASLEARDRQGR
jgi:DNA-binding GntR family transcriptional regulator